MPSIRKKVAGFIRQLSNQSNNDSGDGAPRSPGCFIQKYLSGDVRRQQPDILYGKSCQELPVKQIGCLFPNIFAAFTGPEAGLTTVNRKERHLSTTDPDVDYIDKEDESPTSRKSSKRRHWGAGEGYFFSSNYGTYFIMRKSLSRGRGIPFVDNSVMNIRVMGNVYTIGKRSVETSMSDIHLFTEGRRPSNSNNVVKPDAERVDNSDCCRVGMNGNNTVSSLVEGVPAIGEAPTDVPPTAPEENFEPIARSTNNDNENNNEMFCVDVESNYLTSVIPPPAEYSTSDFEPQTVGCPEEDGDIPSWTDVPDSGPMRSSSDSELNRILRKSVSAPCGTEVDSDNVFLPDTEDTCDFDLCDIAKTITQNELILNNNDKDSVQSFFGCPDYMVDVGTSTNVAGLGFDLDSIHINNNSSACLLNVNPSSNGRTPDQANKEAQKQNGHTNGDVASDENKNQVEELPFKPTTRKDGSYSHSKSSGGKSRKFHRERPSAGGTTSVGGTLAATQNEDIAGVVNWNRSHSRAYGAATTLYECHPVTHQNAGNPIADAFAIVARENSAILALADGVNWGEKACIAARCAVHGCVEYLNKALFGSNGQVSTTADVFVALLRSFHAAHSLILQEDGMLTTLTTAVVLPLKDSSQYVVCVCNVGDSLAYVYSKKYGVREITQGSHDIHSMRDMRDALGALGPVDGQNPELNNLTCSMTVAEAGDIVFLTSDGISDNFDPVVGKFAMPKKADAVKTSSISTGKKQKPIPTSASAGNVLDEDMSRQEMFLPMVEAHQRHELTLLRMEDLLNHGVSGAERPCQTAQELCEQMVDFATKLTVAKRRILEDPDLYTTGDAELSRAEQRYRRKKVCEKLAMVPGKLDHASVVAYMVGEFQEPRKLETVREIGESDEKTTSGGRNVPHNVKKTRENKENLSPNPSLRLEADRSVLLETVV